MNWYNTMMFTLKWQLLTQNTVHCTGRIIAIKKGVNRSNNKERCSARNLDDLLRAVARLQDKTRQVSSTEGSSRKGVQSGHAPHPPAPQKILKSRGSEMLL